MNNLTITELLDQVKMKRERARFTQNRPQLWQARCVECRFRTDWLRASDAQTKAHAHKAAKRHDVDLYAEIFVDRLQA